MAKKVLLHRNLGYTQKADAYKNAHMVTAMRRRKFLLKPKFAETPETKVSQSADYIMEVSVLRFVFCFFPPTPP